MRVADLCFRGTAERWQIDPVLLPLHGPTV